MTEIITTAAELDALLMAVSECAEAAVIQTADRRPYIITEDDSGTFWADSYWQEDEARGPWAAESIPLPWTVLYRPDAEPALVKPSREDVARVIVNHSGHLGTHYMDVALAAADAVLALLPGRAVEEVKAEALEESASDEVAEWARKRTEDQLIELRDAGIFTLRRNGLVIHYPDGEPSPIIRLGFEMAWRDCLIARAASLRGESDD